MLSSSMPSDQPEKPKRDDEADSRKDKEDAGDKDAVRPADKKIPEGDGNLRRRADWFQKRSGQTVIRSVANASADLNAVRVRPPGEPIG